MFSASGPRLSQQDNYNDIDFTEEITEELVMQKFNDKIKGGHDVIDPINAH